MTKLYKWQPTQSDWLPKGDLPADPVCDFKTARNTASVWKIENGGRSERRLLIRRIAVALAAGKDKVDKFEYMLLDRAAVDAAGIEVRKRNGDTADPELNASFHYNLEEISVGRLANLVKTTLSKGPLPDDTRLDRKEIASEIWDGLCKKRLNKASIRPNLLMSAAVLILKSLAFKKMKIGSATISRQVVVAVAEHYLYEYEGGALDPEYVRTKYVEEAEKWVSSQNDS